MGHVSLSKLPFFLPVIDIKCDAKLYFFSFSRATDVARSFRLMVQLHRLCEGSARGNWDHPKGQQQFLPNPNGFGNRTTRLRRLLIGAAFSFLRFLLPYASAGWFPFLSVTNITKLERLHRAANRAISSRLLSSQSFFSLRLFYLPCKSPGLILLFHLVSGLFVSQPSFPFQVWSDLE